MYFVSNVPITFKHYIVKEMETHQVILTHTTPITTHYSFYLNERHILDFLNFGQFVKDTYN